MRVTSALTALCLLLVQPVFAQEWVEYTNRVDRFAVPAPGAPKDETITWDSGPGRSFLGMSTRGSRGGTATQ